MEANRDLSKAAADIPHSLSNGLEQSPPVAAKISDFLSAALKRSCLERAKKLKVNRSISSHHSYYGHHAFLAFRRILGLLRLDFQGSFMGVIVSS